MKMYSCLIWVLLTGLTLQAQPVKPQTRNVVLITLDGLRWQEVFGGVDSALFFNDTFTEPGERKALAEAFWTENAGQRRQQLMPFFWTTIAQQGRLYGNRWNGNYVNLTNQLWFSYPGYNEILTGFADDEHIRSNDKVNNANETVLEFINRQAGFQHKVAVFGSWDVFPYIINAERSGIPVNAGFELPAAGKLSEKEQLLYELQEQIPEEWSTVRFDAFTHHFAKAYLQRHRPRVVYIAYGETDDFAHDGAYEEYLKSTRQTDAFIADLWQFVQSHRFYKDKTTFIITTDHGRGTQPLDNWRHHGRNIMGADETWIAVLGPDTPARGEVTAAGQLYSNQIAKTVAVLLGLNYKPSREAGAAIAEALR